MHGDHTLVVFEEVTTMLGDKLQFFANETCSNYNTFELPHEAAAHKRRKAKKSQAGAPDANDSAGMTRWRKAFKMDTYKHHALGDYVKAIRTYGTCDSYSTELVGEAL
jgi:hypothetical protein